MLDLKTNRARQFYDKYLKNHCTEIIIALVCVSLLGFMVLLSINAFCELKFDRAAWYSFVGSFWGSGIALIISITSITLTMHFERKRYRNDRKKELLAIAPYFKISSDSQIEVKDKEGMLVSLEFILKNVGKGGARTPYLSKNVNIKDDDTLEILFLLDSLPITFETDESVRIKVICRRSEKYQDANLECRFFDMMNNEYIQSFNITNIFNGTGLQCYDRHPILVKDS